MSTFGKLAALSVMLVLVVLATGAAYTESAETVAVDNETVTVDYDNPSVVSAADDAISFSSDVTVRNASDAVLENETDYTWRPVNGTVAWHNTTATTDGESATISYAYDAHSQRSQDLAAVLNAGLFPLALAFLVFAALAVLGWVDLVPGGGR